MGSQVENIFLKTAQCPDGDYDYFVRYYSGHGRPVNLTSLSPSLTADGDRFY